MDVSVGRFGGAAAVVHGKLHLFGGVNMNPHRPEGQDWAQAIDLHHAYDPAADRWWEGAPMPNGRCCGAAGVIDDTYGIAQRGVPTRFWLMKCSSSHWRSSFPGDVNWMPE